jgi:hypothetical protein
MKARITKCNEVGATGSTKGEARRGRESVPVRDGQYGEFQLSNQSLNAHIIGIAPSLGISPMGVTFVLHIPVWSTVGRGLGRGKRSMGHRD